MSPMNLKEGRPARVKKNIRYGGYTLILTAAILAILVLINTAVAQLNEKFGLKLDVTQNQLYSISNQTVDILKDLDQDVYIYTLYRNQEMVSSGAQRITRILEKYALASDKVHVSNVDPVTNPTFTSQFKRDMDEILGDGSMIVSNADRSRYRVFTEMDLYDATINSDLTYTYNGLLVEQCATLGILNVTKENRPRVYFVTGHKEAEMSFARQELEKRNFQVESLDLYLQGDQLTKQDTLIIAGPTEDLRIEEKARLSQFLREGGRLFLMMDVIGKKLPNLEAVLSEYGVTVQPQMVLDADTSYYVTHPLYLMPYIEAHAITVQMRLNNLFAMMPQSISFALADYMPAGVTVSPLLRTSAKSFSKTNPESDVAQQEPDDASGPFIVGLALVKNNGSNNPKDQTRIVLYGTTKFAATQDYASFYGNLELFINSVVYLRNEGEVIQIPPKRFASDVLQLPNDTVKLNLMVLVLAVIPALVLITGFVIWLRRRHL